MFQNVGPLARTVQMLTSLIYGLLKGSFGGAPTARNLFPTMGLLHVGSASLAGSIEAPSAPAFEGPPSPVATRPLQAPSGRSSPQSDPALSVGSILAPWDLKHLGPSSFFNAGHFQFSNFLLQAGDKYYTCVSPIPGKDQLSEWLT